MIGVGDRVEICRSMFEGETGEVVDVGRAGVQVVHTLGPVWKEDGTKIERDGTATNWISRSSLRLVF